MAVKGKNRKQKRTRSRTLKSSLRRRTYHNRKTRAQRRMRGGNYAKDVTTRTLEGYPMKPLNKVVTTVPGRGVMSAAAYVKMMEDIDRNGSDLYD